MEDAANEREGAKVLTEVGKRTEVFTRFSTVAGGAGSVDTPRDVRGFAVKLNARGSGLQVGTPPSWRPSLACGRQE